MADNRKPPSQQQPDPNPPRPKKRVDDGPPGQSPSAENLEGGKKSGVLDLDSVRAKNVKTLKPT